MSFQKKHIDHLNDVLEMAIKRKMKKVSIKIIDIFHKKISINNGMNVEKILRLAEERKLNSVINTIINNRSKYRSVTTDTTDTTNRINNSSKSNSFFGCFSSSVAD